MFKDTASTEIYNLSGHDARPIYAAWRPPAAAPERGREAGSIEFYRCWRVGPSQATGIRNVCSKMLPGDPHLRPQNAQGLGMRAHRCAMETPSCSSRTGP